MKAEHRHELKTNDLAQSLITFQDYAKRYGGRVALGIAIVILAVVLVMQRVSRKRDRDVQQRNDLAVARQIIEQLSPSFDFLGRPAPRPANYDKVPQMLRDVRDNASDKTVQAETLVLMGDYSWNLANSPEPAGAATQPSLKLDKGHSEYLTDAKNAYQQVVDQYADQQMSLAAARFGLAAVAENQQNWDEAKKQYEAVKAIAGAPDLYKNYAESKLKRLDEIRQPILVGHVMEKFELPPPATTQSATGPTTGAATRSATQVIAPATKATTGATTRPAK